MPATPVTSLTILPSASRADTNSVDYVNKKYIGAEFIVQQTAQGSTTAFVSVKVQGKIPGTTSYYTVGTITPATSATFSKRMKIYPGASTALDSTGLQPAPAPYAVNDYLPAIWRISSTNVSTSAVTYSVSVNLYGA